MDKKNDGGSAFPNCLPKDFQYAEDGMSLRDFFAAHIASGLAEFSGPANIDYGPREIAGRSYEIADAMIKGSDE